MDISEKTIIRGIKEGTGFKSYWAAKKPFISEINRQRRIEWCQAHLHWTTDEWLKVIWSDESPYVLRFNVRKIGLETS